MKPHGFHREALEEYAQAAADYAAIQPELGGRFYDEVERLISFIGGFGVLSGGTSQRFFPSQFFTKTSPTMFAF